MSQTLDSAVRQDAVANNREGLSISMQTFHFTIQDWASTTFPFAETYIYVSVLDKSCKKLDEHRQGHTEQGKA